MKKLVQVSLASLVTIALLMGVFQLALYAWIDVGWNSGVGASAPQSQQFALCTRCDLKVDPGVSPSVGWNSGF